MPYPIPRPPKYKTRVRKSVTGFGLYAEEAIPKNKFVIEYYGKIVSDAEGEKIGGMYLFSLGNKTLILGATRKNTARYINHSCRPNCEATGPANRVFIQTIRNIKPGEELTYDYGKEHFDEHIKPHGCRCVKCAKKK